MKTSGLVKLIAVTVVVVLVGWLLRDDGAVSAGGAEQRGERWLPALHERVNDVARVRVVAGDERFAVSRGDDGWTLDEWGGYPAEFDQVVGTVLGLSALTIDAPKTARAGNHAQLQLEDPAGAGAASLGLTLEDASGAVLADVVVGKAKGTSSLFVRRAGEDQTWEVDGKLSPPREPGGWVDKELLRVPAAEVVAVTVDANGEPPLRIAKDAAGTWALDPPVEGREVKAGAPYSSLAGALAYLDLEAVATPEQAAEEREWTTTRFQTSDGLVVAVQIAESDAKAWARLSFEAGEPLAAESSVAAADDATGDATGDESGDAVGDAVGETVGDEGGEVAADASLADADEDSGGEEGPDASAAGGEADADANAAAAEAAADEAAAAAAEALATRVAELNARHAGWTYRIPTWKLTALRKTFDDFLEPLPEVGPELPEAALDGEADAPPADGAASTGDEPEAEAAADDADADADGDGAGR